MKKFIVMILVFTMVMSFFVFGENENIKIEGEVGFDNTYRPYYTTPIFITMENNYKDIEGEIQIEIPSGDGYGNAVTIYAIGINHPKGTEKKYTMSLTLPSYLLNIKLKVVEGKKVLTEKYIRINRETTAENAVTVGLLSDDRDSLNYLRGFTVDSFGNSSPSKIINIDEERLPDTLDVMKNFDILIVNNYDTSKLSDKQYSSIKKWVNAGGILVIGTGANGNKSLSVFQDDFITGERGEVSLSTSKELGYYVNDEFHMPIDLMEINTIEGEALILSGEMPIVQKLDKGNGAILLLSFDLGLEPMVSWKLNKYFIESLFQAVSTNMEFGPINEKYQQNFDYNVESALKSIPELPLPNYGTIIIIFILYIILVSPVSYIILKKRDKREYMWLAVPLLSIIFAAFIYIVGFGTRITEPILNTVSIIRGSEKGIYDIKSYGGIFTPNKTTIKIQGLDDINIKPYSRNNYYGYNDNQTWDGKRVDSKFILSPKPSLEIYDMGVWGMKTFEIQWDKSIVGNIKSNISFVNSDYEGFIENNTDFDFEDCYILTANQYIKLSDIKKGEKIEIPKGEIISFANRYELLDSLYSRYYQRGNTPKGEELLEKRREYQKRGIIEYFINLEGQKVQGIKLIAWSNAPIVQDISVNNKNLLRYDNTLLAFDLELDMQLGKKIELPYGYIEPSIIQDSMFKVHYDDYDNRFYGRGEAEVHFEIKEKIEVESISIKTENPSPGTKQFIWNRELSAWEEQDLELYNLSSGDINVYLDDYNILKLKFHINDDGMQLPQISVKGSAK